MENVIAEKYFWSVSDKALKKYVAVLKNPLDPIFREKMISFLSLCDKPEDLFKIISRDVFIEQWPAIRKVRRCWPSWRRLNPRPPRRKRMLRWKRLKMKALLLKLLLKRNCSSF